MIYYEQVVGTGLWHWAALSDKGRAVARCPEDYRTRQAARDAAWEAARVMAEEVRPNRAHLAAAFVWGAVLGLCVTMVLVAFG